MSSINTKTLAGLCLKTVKHDGADIKELETNGTTN